MKSVFRAGEGRSELGGWIHEHPYREESPSAGVLECLLRRNAKTDFTVVGAVCWKDIRKFRAGRPEPAEVRNVKGAALRAKEQGAAVLCFGRDRDGDRTREMDVERGINEAEEALAMRVVGGCAVEAIESWVLTLTGDTNAERHPKPKTKLPPSLATTSDMVAALEGASFEHLPPKAESLARWLERARRHLG